MQGTSRSHISATLRFTTLAAGLLAAEWQAAGQIGGTGVIQGVVADQSGAVIAGATVVGTNVNTGVATVRKTTDAGLYVLSPLPPGEYTITFSSPGFQVLIQEHVIVDALSSVGLNATLRVGTATEQVTVTDAPPTINTVDARMGQTMRREVYTALPLTMGAGGSANNIARDPTAFVTLMPGVSNFGGQTAGQVNGSQTGSQEVYVEGIAITNAVLQGESRPIAIGITVEAIEQFQLETAGAPVMYNGQGATNFVLKSGTNAFHGAAYSYVRNTVFDARGFFATARPVQNQNEFGFNVGGPIRRNRIFFFGAYDGFRKRQASPPRFFTLPTLRQRSGDFSEFPVAIYDPATTNCSSGPCTRSPFAGNIIPASRLSSVSGYMQSFLPDPTNSNIQNNYLGSVPTGHNTNSTTNKVDINLTEAHQFYALFSLGGKTMTRPYSLGVLPLPYGDSRLISEIMTTAQARHTWVMSSTLLNQFSASFSRFWVPIQNTTIEGQYPIKAGLTGLPPGEADSAFPTMTFSGPNAPTQWRGSNSPAFDEATNNLTLQDNLQWTRGKHSLTAGIQVQWLQANEKLRTYGSTASWAFSNTQTAGFNSAGTLLTATGHPYASYLLGAVNSNNITDDWVVGTGARFRTYAWWLQDNVRVTPRLTLNLGLRHDIFLPWVEVRDRMSWLNPTLPNPAIGGFPGALQFAGHGENSCQCRNDFSTYYRNYGPRVGFAYTLTRNTVIRAGYMMNYTRRGSGGGAGSGKVGTGTLGFSANVAFTSLDAGISPAYYWDNGVPGYQKAPFFDSTLNTGFTTSNPQGGSITYGNPLEGNRPPRYQNWNVSIQHALTPTFTMDVSYVANNGHFLGGGPRGRWEGHIHPRYLALGNLLRSAATPASIAQAQRLFPEIALPYANFSGVISQMLRPFPQYSSVSDPWGNVGNINYNSLQIIGRKNLSHGLIFNFNYTLSKAFDDLDFRNGYIAEKAQADEPTHAVNVMFVYALPFGRESQLGGRNRFIRAVAGNWQVSGITTYRSGTGFGPIGAACNLPNAGNCYADYNPAFSGPVRINGDYGSGNLIGGTPTPFLDRNAFVSPAPFTFGSTPRTLAYGLRNPSRYDQNLSLRREFPIAESWRLSVQADAINVFNMVNFSNPNIDITSSAFGTINGQSNLPRLIQLSARLAF